MAWTPPWGTGERKRIHFPRRDDLIRALGAEIGHQLDAVHRRSRAEGGSAADQIARMLRSNVLLGNRLRFYLEHWDELLGRLERSEMADSWMEPFSAAKEEGAIRADLPLDWINQFASAIQLVAFRLIDDGTLSAEEAAELASSSIMRGWAPDESLDRDGNVRLAVDVSTAGWRSAAGRRRTSRITR